MRLIDRYMPAYQFHETHARRIAAVPGAILAGVTAYRAESDWFFRLMSGVRALPARLLTPRNGQREPFGLHAFTLLEQTESEIVYGLIGRFWKPDYGLAAIADGAAFHAFNTDNAAKLVLAFWTQPEPDGRTRLVTETRVWCPSRAVRLTFTPYWLLIRPASGFIRHRMLAAIARDCERPSRPDNVIAADTP